MPNDFRRVLGFTLLFKKNYGEKMNLCKKCFAVIPTIQHSEYILNHGKLNLCVGHKRVNECEHDFLSTFPKDGGFILECGECGLKEAHGFGSKT